MTSTQFFTDSIAATLADALSEMGISLPVYGQISEPEAEHDRIEVRCSSTEEIIPGNFTTRLDCQAVLVLSATSNDAWNVTSKGMRIASVVRSVLGRDWRGKPLRDPRPETDAEYAAAPFIVLDLVPAATAVDTSTGGYELQAEFRAYVQF